MFRTYQTLLNRLLMCLDAVLIFAAIMLAWYVKFQSGLLQHQDNVQISYYMGPIIVTVLTIVIANSFGSMYKPMRAKSLWAEAYNVLRGAAIGALVMMSVLYFFKMQQFSRETLALFLAFYVALMLFERLSIRMVLRTLRRRGFNQRYILIVGWNHAAERFVDVLESQPWFGYRILGYLSDNEAKKAAKHGVPRIGELKKLPEILSAHLLDHVIIALPRNEFAAISQVIANCEVAGTQSLILPDYFDLLPARPRFETFGDMPLIDTRYVPLDDALNAALKRTFDIVFSAVVLILLSWLYGLIALGVKMSSPGPVIYRQERVGKNRRTFQMYKFRTMRHDEETAQSDDETDADTGWTIENDPRCTRFGAFLRRTSLDELPQFWNALVGDMSVIGPRPERPFFVEQFRDEIPKYMIKHRVRPGITGWAQVHGWRGDTSISQRIEYDIEYIENWSFWMDLRIVLRTLRNGFVHQNAY